MKYRIVPSELYRGWFRIQYYEDFFLGWRNLYLTKTLDEAISYLERLKRIG